MLGKMVARNDNFAGGYFRNTNNAAGESEGFGSSGRVDAEFTASEDSSGPTRKCISLNSDKGAIFLVPSEVLPMSSMTASERKSLIHRLKLELEQIRILQKKLELQRSSAVAVSSSSDILSCSNGRTQPDAVRKSSALTSAQEKKVKSLGGKGEPCKRSFSGKIEPTKEVAVPRAADAILMNQCEALLKRLMSHQFAWVFNKPVDVKALNIPDYFTVIKHPMDLGTVKSNISTGAYSSPLEFVADVRLTFTNAMTYNPPGNDVHIMADALSKFFEVRWKTIEKRLVVSESQTPVKSGPSKDKETAKRLPPAKKRKISSIQYEVVPEPVQPVMTDEEKHDLGRQLESIMEDMPEQIIDFLRENSSNGRQCGEEEIEIDIDDLSNDTLFTLRKLVHEYLQEKQKGQARDEQCEIEILHESGFSNSSIQPSKANGDEDVDIGGNESPVSSYPPVKKENDASQRATIGISEDASSDSDLGSSSDSESDRGKALTPKNERKTKDSEVQKAEKESQCHLLDVNQPISGLDDQLDQASPHKLSSLDSDSCQDGESAANERQASPGKLYRAALLKSRFADTILKAREKTLPQGDKGDPEKLRREKEELELHRRKERARLQAEAKAAEDARRQLEAEALAEVKRKRELEREAARQALLKMEKTVEINENSRFLEDLEMLSTVPGEQLPSSVDETSPDNNSLDRLGSFKFGGSNPLEQLGLFIKPDYEEEEPEPPVFSNPGNDVEEGEID